MSISIRINNMPNERIYAGQQRTLKVLWWRVSCVHIRVYGL